MRIGLALAAVLALASAASAQDAPTALFVSPIHVAQIVRGDDGMDHVEYELLVVSVFSEPVTLASVAVLDPAGKELLRIEGEALAAATQTLFAKTPGAVIPASAAASVDFDLVVPPGTAPERLKHRFAYTLAAGSQTAPMIDTAFDGPEVPVDRRPAIVVRPPVRGDGWLVSSACCAPNIHRDLRVAMGGVRIETPETFAIDFARARGTRIFDGDGKRNEQHYAFGEDVFAVADGTVVAIRNDAPDEAPFAAMIPASKADYGGNQVVLEIAPKVFALYVHLQRGSIAVKVGDAVKAGARLARIGNSGPSDGPHLHFGLYDRPDLYGRSLPFVFDAFTTVGAIDLDHSEGDHLVIVPNPRQLRGAYPLYGGVQNYP